LNRTPFDTASFGNWFRERCREAGVRKELSIHGLRKAACRRLAEAGCTPHEIMAISGHTTLKEVTRYTNKVDRKHMARIAMKRLRGTP
jgi:integrase